jgi:hypothetical protein
VASDLREYQALRVLEARRVSLALRVRKELSVDSVLRDTKESRALSAHKVLRDHRVVSVALVLRGLRAHSVLRDTRAILVLRVHRGRLVALRVHRAMSVIQVSPWSIMVPMELLLDRTPLSSTGSELPSH